ncbi:hypothetical protein KIN20_027769 [Parelaphostrongylus tenuis]|uniref:Uncharacterized protein n=1 Tax=Parelaphostrongylus tenuis TaxID=148309 RepID=A0AAD5R016_PARTN|nr:hypothetical protein KIN20_027769 [Parelaphostrongylus tenuis]
MREIAAICEKNSYGRQLLKKPQQKSAVAKIINRSHFLAPVPVWAGICVIGKTLLIFINGNVKINTAQPPVSGFLGKDSSVWCVLREKVQATSYAGVNEPKTAFARDWDRNTMKMSSSIVGSFPKLHHVKCNEAQVSTLHMGRKWKIRFCTTDACVMRNKLLHHTCGVYGE